MHVPMLAHMEASRRVSGVFIFLLNLIKVPSVKCVGEAGLMVSEL